MKLLPPKRHYILSYDVGFGSDLSAIIVSWVHPDGIVEIVHSLTTRNKSEFWAFDLPFEIGSTVGDIDTDEG